MRVKGLVTKNQNGYFSVTAVTGQEYICKATGKLKLNTENILVGDRVEVNILTAQTGQIINVLPRKRQLVRPPVANPDQMIIVTSVNAPTPNPLLLDQIILMCEHRQIPLCLCFSKMDLADTHTDELLTRYRRIPYPVMTTQIGEPLSLNTIKTALQGKITAVCGPSGVGKSTLLNQIAGREIFPTQAISKKIKRGRNTTRHAEIIRLAPDTYIVDTPGFGTMDLFLTDPREIAVGFKEFRPYVDLCKFDNCIHLSEPTCAVKEAVQQKTIAAERYDNYAYLVNQWNQQQKERYR